jgi:hypothetical protein
VSSTTAPKSAAVQAACDGETDATMIRPAAATRIRMLVRFIANVPDSGGYSSCEHRIDRFRLPPFGPMLLLMGASAKNAQKSLKFDDNTPRDVASITEDCGEIGMER